MGGVASERSAADREETTTASGGTDGSDGEPSIRNAIVDFALIAFGLLSMTYGNLLLYNTGTFEVAVREINTTFSYAPPVGAMAGTLLLYLVGFASLLSVGADWRSKASKLIYVTPVVYLSVGLLFFEHVFAEPIVRERVTGGRTDGYVLQYHGAKRLLDGVNPYGADYAEEIMRLVPAYFRTPKSVDTTPETVINGTQIVTNLDYPPMSAIWYIPAQVFGVSGTVQDMVAVLVIAVILFLVADPAFRPFVSVFLLLDWNLILFPASFVPDIGWVLLTVGAFVTFHRPTYSATMFALAASYRPQPIIIAPYFAIMAYHAHGIEYFKRWIPVGLGVTALLNVPFLLWTGPERYLRLITLPVRTSLPVEGVCPSMLVEPLVEAGFGTAVAYQPVFTIAVLGAWILTLWLSIRYYDRLGAGMFAFPGLVLWFHWRSMQNYLIWFPLFVLLVYLLDLPDRDPIAVSGIDDRLARVRSSIERAVR